MEPDPCVKGLPFSGITCRVIIVWDDSWLGPLASKDFLYATVLQHSHQLIRPVGIIFVASEYWYLQYSGFDERVAPKVRMDLCEVSSGGRFWWHGRSSYDVSSWR